MTPCTDTCRNPPHRALRTRKAQSALTLTNEARCARLLRRSSLLDTDGIIWDTVGRTPVDRGVLDCLVYMRDVEGFTSRYLTGFATHPATMRDPLIARFLRIWQAEEAAHARALDHYLTLYSRRMDRPVAPMPAPPPVNHRERWLALLTLPAGHVVTAAHMSWGAANELLTMTGYRLLAHRCGDPALADLLRRIAAQESRHYGFYRLQAESRLARSPLARHVVRRLMGKTWTPVGVGNGFKTRGEFDRVLAYLAGDEQGRAAAVAMDAAISRLPGCNDLTIFSDAIDDAEPRISAETPEADAIEQAQEVPLDEDR